MSIYTGNDGVIKTLNEIGELNYNRYILIWGRIFNLQKVAANSEPIIRVSIQNNQSNTLHFKL